MGDDRAPRSVRELVHGCYPHGCVRGCESCSIGTRMDLDIVGKANGGKGAGSGRGRGSNDDVDRGLMYCDT